MVVDLVDRAATATDDDERAVPHCFSTSSRRSVKSWPSQWCLTANDLAIQVLGGYGYTQGVRRRAVLPRQPAQPDSRGHARCAGHRPAGPQVHDEGGAGLRRWSRPSPRPSSGPPPPEATPPVTPPRCAPAPTDPRHRHGRVAAGDPAVALANATAFLEATGHTVLAWLWLLEQFLAAAARRRFLTASEPRRNTSSGTSCPRRDRCSIWWSRETAPPRRLTRLVLIHHTPKGQPTQ